MLYRVLIVLLLSSCALAGQVWSGAERIVAVGDVHGDYKQFTTLLRQAAVLDEKDRWIGGATHLVQTGDVPDRGPDTRRILELLMKLGRPARKAGGNVHALIGNHEAMNVYGDLRYVTPEEFEAFKKGSSGQLRDQAYQMHLAQVAATPLPDGTTPVVDEAYKAEWEEAHPLGFYEHRNTYNPRGEYGRWIRKNNAVIQIDDTIFVHGGISPRYADADFGALNAQIASELNKPATIPGGVVVDPVGPLWYRGLAQDPEEALAAHVDHVLAKNKAARIVIGHTPTAGTVLPRFGGKVLMIDVGLSAAYGGRMACLIIENGQPYTLHRGQRIELPKDDSPEELLRYLSAAASLDPGSSPLAPIVQALEAANGQPEIQLTQDDL